MVRRASEERGARAYQGATVSGRVQSRLTRLRLAETVMVLAVVGAALIFAYSRMRPPAREPLPMLLNPSPAEEPPTPVVDLSATVLTPGKADSDKTVEEIGEEEFGLKFYPGALVIKATKTVSENETCYAAVLSTSDNVDWVSGFYWSQLNGRPGYEKKELAPDPDYTVAHRAAWGGQRVEVLIRKSTEEGVVTINLFRAVKD